MDRYAQINDMLYFVQKEINANAKTEEVKATTNHIFIYDRSGSMHRLLPQLAKDLIERSKKIPFGDTISIGWFSSEKQFSFILKGFKISEDADYKVLETAIENNKSSLGTTCFSEILHETADNVIRDLSCFSDRFSLIFFTDGCPVVSNYNKEIESIFSAINKLEKTLTASLLVGYGNYYNKELMASMAEKIGGSLVHSNDLPSFTFAYSEFINSIQQVENKIKISVDKNPKNVYFSVSDGNVNVYSSNGEEIFYTPMKGRKNYLYVLTDKEPSNGQKINLTDGEVGKNTKIEPFIKGLYASAYIMLQKTKTTVALDILSAIGDKSLIDSVVNAFTNEEYGKAENRILECVKSSHKRFLKGRDVNHLPARDAFCMIDFVDLLCSDDEAFFYPNHKAFEYRKIGIQSVAKEGYPEFENSGDNKCKFSTVSWNNSRLNLSVLAKLNGRVKLKKNYKSYGFTSNYFDTFVWRNYTIVKDGCLNVDKLPISCSKDTLDTLVKNGVVVDKSDNDIFVIDLTSMPIINRVIAERETSAKKLFEMSFEEIVNKAFVKTYKHYLNKLVPEKKVNAFGDLTNEQANYLAEIGVTEKGFQPPTESVEPTDFYFAKEFKINVAKFSSLPKIEDVENKIVSNKNLTPSDGVVAKAIESFKKSIKDMDDSEKVKWLDNAIKITNSNLRKLSTNIQKIKFAIVLGNQWFDEFDSRDNCSMDVDGVNFNIKLDSEKRINI